MMTLSFYNHCIEKITFRKMEQRQAIESLLNGGENVILDAAALEMTIKMILTLGSRRKEP